MRSNCVMGREVARKVEITLSNTVVFENEGNDDKI